MEGWGGGGGLEVGERRWGVWAGERRWSWVGGGGEAVAEGGVEVGERRWRGGVEGGGGWRWGRGDGGCGRGDETRPRGRRFHTVSCQK